MGCYAGEGLSEEPLDPDRAWVRIVYSGGQQCGPHVSYEPPAVAQVLGEADATVYETAVQPMAVCAACLCPAYAAAHFALIDRVDVPPAQALGFEESNAPNR